MNPEELRYHEIIFIRLVLNYFQHYNQDKLMPFCEFLSAIGEASLPTILAAVRQIIMHDRYIMPCKDEMIRLCINHKGMSTRETMKELGIGNKTVSNSLAKDFYMTNKFDVLMSNEVAKVVKAAKHFNTFM